MNIRTLLPPKKSSMYDVTTGVDEADDDLSGCSSKTWIQCARSGPWFEHVLISDAAERDGPQFAVAHSTVRVRQTPQAILS